MTYISLSLVFLFGVVVGVIATLIYWPWIEDDVMGYDKDE